MSTLADTNRLANFIDHRMRQVNIKSRRELARKMGRDETAISKLITRGSIAPTAELVRDLARVLRVDLEEIYWALGLTDTRPGEEKQEGYIELENAFRYMDENKRQSLLEFAEHLLRTSNGNKK
jgi:DNA-binding XRE family transcriptional regulator